MPSRPESSSATCSSHRATSVEWQTFAAFHDHFGRWSIQSASPGSGDSAASALLAYGRGRRPGGVLMVVLGCVQRGGNPCRLRRCGHVVLRCGQPGQRGFDRSRRPDRHRRNGRIQTRRLLHDCHECTVHTPTGMTERCEIVNSGSVKLASEAADSTLGAIGPTGGRTATGSKSAVSIGQLIVLLPLP